jgi:glycosyltransferase involved in cell wall biosynthesis
MEPPSILWIVSYLRHPSGNSEEARAFLRALEMGGYEPCALELGSRGKEGIGDGKTVALDSEHLEILVRALERKHRQPLVAVHAYTPRRERRYAHPQAVNVARVMFETDRLPDGWAGMLADRTQVWVPSTHNQRTFAEGGVPESKLRVLGETIDFDLFSPDAEPLELDTPEGHLTFLSNFDFSERKGWRQLLLAWARAFDANDPVCLVLKTLSVARWDEEYARARIRHFVEKRLGGGEGDRLAPIAIVAERLPSPDLPRLYAAADAYVSPSRGEAWGRTYMEAMAMGLPTIGTAWGGHLDFMSDDGCWLVPGELVPVADDADVVDELYRGHRWFEADVDALADAMREIANYPAGARHRAAGARARLIAGWGPGVVADRIADLAGEALAADQPTEVMSA